MKYLFLIIPFLFISCNKGKNNQYVEGSGQVAYYAEAIVNSKASSIKRGNNISGASITAIKWSAASIFVMAMVFEGTKDSKVITNKTVNANLDLFSSKDSIGKITPPDGNYKDVKVMLHLKKSIDSKLSFLLNASYTDHKGAIIPIRVGNSDEFQVRLSVSDITINPVKDYKVLIRYDLDKVWDGISIEDLDRAYRISNGTMVISSSLNTELYEIIKKNWQNLASAQFVEI